MDAPNAAIAPLFHSVSQWARRRWSFTLAGKYPVKCELPPNNRNRPDDELLADLKRVASELDSDTVARDTFAEHGRFHPATLVGRFGTWNEALKRAGLRVAKRQTIATTELIADLQRVASAVAPRSMTESLYRVHGHFSPDSLARRFGSWSKSLTAAGLDASHVPDAADPEALFSNLERVWEHIGRAPRKADMRAPGSEYSAAPYVRVFGSWRSALEAFVLATQSTPALLDELPPSPNDQAIPSEQRRHRTGRNIGWRLRFLVMKRDSFSCRYCGASPAHRSSTILHVDRVHPWSAGGETVFENLQTLCDRCNIGKGTDHVGEAS